MIYVTETLRIARLDRNCLELQKLRAVKPKDGGELHKEWASAGYYGAIKDVIHGALRYQLFESASEELTAKQLSERIEAAENNCLTAIKNIGESDL